MGFPQIRINGIRLNSGLIQDLEFPVVEKTGKCLTLYQDFAKARINICCLGLLTDTLGSYLFCCHDIESVRKSDLKGLPSPGTRNLDLSSNVSIVSVYPHHCRLNTLGFLIGLFGKNQIAFQQMVSSNAMISFVINEVDQERVLALLALAFDLPSTHTPFQQNFAGETAAFVKKRYPETSATYVEKKIKTYGIQMDSNLSMFEICFNPNLADHLQSCGDGLGALGEVVKKFYFTTAMTKQKDACHLFCLTDPLTSRDRQDFFSKVQAVRGIDFCEPVLVDLIGFHGPHFGDRFGVFNTAMDCLKKASLEVLLAGCTGASICMVLPVGQGQKAIPALSKGFETP
ncbi:MAG: hypothetical protein GY710_24475 [Desulfobacteraceae bacterium]|nr:hypothetical protein [Desulfobacteraceae bacterium]